jgi:uncharacterized membrane protein
MTLFLGLLFGGVGTVFLALAKKDHDVTYLICGCALIFFPYFIGNALLTVIIGAALTAFPIARYKGLI